MSSSLGLGSNPCGGSTESWARKTLDKVSRALVQGGHGEARRRSLLGFRARRTDEEEGSRRGVDGGNGLGGELGVSRRKEKVREALQAGSQVTPATAWSPRTCACPCLGKTTEGGGGLGRLGLALGAR